MKQAKLILFCTGALALALMAAGCAAPKPFASFRHRGTGEHIKKVAVLPFENVSETLDADRKMTSIFLSALHNSLDVDVVEEGEVERFLRANRIRQTGEIDVETAAKLCETLKIQAVIVGTVGEYTSVSGPNGSVPVVSLTIRMVDAAGTIILAVTHVREGDDSETVFGLGRITSTIRLSKIVVDDIVDKTVEFIGFYNSASQPEEQARDEAAPSEEETIDEPPKPLPKEVVEEPVPEVKPVPPKEEPRPELPPEELTEEELKRLKEQARENAREAWNRIKKQYEAEGKK